MASAKCSVPISVLAEDQHLSLQLYVFDRKLLQKVGAFPLLF